MSLINDALKRASQSTTAPAPAPASKVPPDAALRPVDYKPNSPSWPRVMFTTLLVIGISIGGWLFFRNSGGSNNRAANTDETNVQARQPATAPTDTPLAVAPVPGGNTQHASEPPKAILVAAPAASRPVAALPIASASTVLTAPQAAVSSAPLPQATVPAPVYKLQGIFYRPAHPMAMINGRNVSPGDKVADAKVITIQRDSVTLSVDGQTKVLTLSQNN
ncbi:MAG: hypothetical protein JWM16_372 [Verrucomicrobiales bacterium]|nr:hypothetical protein [Verrucomicrobiales bacterium]